MEILNEPYSGNKITSLRFQQENFAEEKIVLKAKVAIFIESSKSKRDKRI